MLPYKGPSFLYLSTIMELVLYCLAIISCFFGAEACDGYTLHVQRLTNCEENNILKLQNFNVTLTEDCIVKSSGCIENCQDVHSFKVSYTIYKNSVPFTGVRDACKTLEGANEEVTTVLNLFAIPASCPLKKGKFCNDNNKSLDISKYRRKLPLLLGDIQATVKIQTDAGNSCIEFKGAVTKRIMPRLPVLG